MLRQNVSRAVRFLRHRAGLRQRELAERVGVSREMVSRLERGAIAGMTIDSVARVASSLDAALLVELRWRGEQLDRLMDAAHASVQERAVRYLREREWRSEAEVSFNWYGDRGRVDAVAFHPETRTLLIVEAKVRFGYIQDTLGKLDVKTRLGPQLARQLGWPEPAQVVPCLVVAEGRTARRTVAEHPQLFARFSLRGRAALRWLAAPTAERVSGVLIFESLPDSHAATGRQRIRRRNALDLCRMDGRIEVLARRDCRGPPKRRARGQRLIRELVGGSHAAECSPDAADRSERMDTPLPNRYPSADTPSQWPPEI